MMENKILYYLKTHCTGIDRAIPSKDLCRTFGITDRDLRQLKRNIVLNLDARVGSTKNGFFYAENDNEVKMFRNDYKSRSDEYWIMINRYDKYLKRKDQMQLI